MDQIHQEKQNPALTCILEEQSISSQTPQKRDEATRTDKDAKIPGKLVSWILLASNLFKFSSKADIFLKFVDCFDIQVQDDHRLV